MRPSVVRQPESKTSVEPPLLLLRILLLISLGLVSIQISNKTRPNHAENEFKHIRKRETIYTKKNYSIHIEKIPQTNGKKHTKSLTDVLNNRQKKVLPYIPRDKAQESPPLPGDRQLNSQEGAAFSCYLRQDRKMEKGDKREMAPFSQHSFAHRGELELESGRFLSNSSGLFMISATVHVRTDTLIIPGHKKKMKMKSKKPPKTQMNLHILVDNKFKAKRSLSSTGLLPGQGGVTTLTAGGLLQVEAGQRLSVLIQVSGSVHVLAGSHFSGLSVGP